MAKVYKSADQLIGGTPLLELGHIEKEFGLEAKILAKLELFNVTGSVKDRIAKSMLKRKSLERLNPARQSSSRPAATLESVWPRLERRAATRS